MCNKRTPQPDIRKLRESLDWDSIFDVVVRRTLHTLPVNVREALIIEVEAQVRQQWGTK